jgi:hypothetical protein
MTRQFLGDRKLMARIKNFFEDHVCIKRIQLRKRDVKGVNVALIVVKEPGVDFAWFFE